MASIKNTSPFDYPIVIRKHLNFITISVPDLGISLIEEIPSNNLLNKNYVTKIGVRVAEAWLKAQKIIKDKTDARIYLPKASQTKASVQQATQNLSPTQFAKFVGISPRTITRDCAKGIIRASRTTGGHYKIPVAQLALYKQYLSQHQKFATDNWLKSAMDKLQTLHSTS